MTVTPDYEDDLLDTALRLVDLVRDDLDAAHRTTAALTHLELRQVVCVLAAMVDPDASVSQLAWWRVLSPT